MIKLVIIFIVILIEFHRIRSITANGYVIDDDNQFSATPPPSSTLVEINNRNGKFLCYGLLISDSWVLSRADCVNEDYCYNCDDGFYRLKFGINAGDVNEVEVNTTRFLVHPHYNREIGLGNNIALLHLPAKLILNEVITPARLPVIIGDRTQNHSELLTFMCKWYARNICTRYRVTTNLQWIRDVTLIQEASM